MGPADLLATPPGLSGPIVLSGAAGLFHDVEDLPEHEKCPRAEMPGARGLFHEPDFFTLSEKCPRMKMSDRGPWPPGALCQSSVRRTPKWLMALDVGAQMEYLRLMNETTSMPEVYAVFAMGMDYYDRAELVKIFGAMAAAEDYAEELRGAVEDAEWEGAEPEPAFASVKVQRWSVN